MISPPAGWTVTRCDGGLRIEPPQGPLFGVLRYLERVRPLRSLRDVIAAHPVPLGWSESSASPTEHFITDEGEHAAVAWRTGTINSKPCERSLGLVFADDYYARLTGVCFVPEAFEPFRHHIRDLLRRDCHMLGVRRRRCTYEPPPGWHGILDGVFHTTWLPPTAPRDSTALIVMPAAPRSEGIGEALIASVLGDAPLEQAIVAHERIHARHGLMGDAFRMRIADRATSLAILEDTRFAYAVRADSTVTDADSAYAALRALVTTLEPIPDPQRDLVTNRAAAILHWTE